MQIRFTYLLLLHSLIPHAVTNSLLQLPQNTSGTIPASASALNLAAPSPPPGFRTTVTFDRSQRLHPTWYFIVVSGFFLDLARHGWNDRITTPIIRKLIINLAVEPTTMHDDSFFNTEAAISLNNNPIGRVRIFFELTSPPVNNENGQIANKSAGLGNVTSTSILTTDSGTVHDPTCPDIEVRWEYQGPRINSKDLFLAILDGMASAARPDGSSRCNHLDAVSPLSSTGQAVISLREEGGGGAGGRGMTYDDVKVALYLVWRDVNVGLNKFGEMNFDIFVKGVKRGRGEVLRLPPVAAVE
ncbi:hypothetical protein ACLMJK_005658 [Lecanora helva]